MWPNLLSSQAKAPFAKQGMPKALAHDSRPFL